MSGLAARSLGRTKLQVHAKTQNTYKIAQNHKSNPYIQIDNEKLYTNGSYLPAPAFGPVKLTSIQGQGRGLVLTDPAGNGTLLVVSAPAGRVVRAAEGLELQLEHLMPTLQEEGVLSEEDRRRMRLLFNGQASSARTMDLQTFLGTKAPGTKQTAKAVEKKAKGFGAAPPPTTPKADDTPSGAPPMSPEELHDILRFNSWGQEYADLGAAATRGETSHSYIGLWPEFALANHSCIPNTTTVLIGDRLLLRGARPKMMEDTQATTSYLGFDGCAPVSERHRKLQHTYGFTCNCPRCKLESSQPQAVTTVLEDMWGLLAEGLPDRVRTLITTRDAAGAQVVQRQLEQQIGRLEALMEQNQVPQQSRDWLRASAYGTYELLAVIKSQQLDSESLDSGQQLDGQLEAGLVPLMEVIAPGSDGHLFLTLEWLDLAGKKWGKGTPQADAAAKACLTAHIVRYGTVPDAILTQLMTERGKNDYHMGRVDLPTTRAAAPTTEATEAATPALVA